MSRYDEPMAMPVRMLDGWWHLTCDGGGIAFWATKE